MGMLFCLQPKSSGGTRRSRTEGRALRTNSAQAVLQQQELENNVARVKIASLQVAQGVQGRKGER